MAKRSGPKLTGNVGLDVYRLARAGEVEEAKKRIRGHLRFGSVDSILRDDRSGSSAFSLWAEARCPSLLTALDEARIPWTVPRAAMWDQNAPDPTHGGMRPLHLAAQPGNAVRLVDLLLDAGADQRGLSEVGETPLDVARRAKHRGVEKRLEAVHEGSRDPSGLPK